MGNVFLQSFPKLAKLMANLIRGESSENSRMDVLASLRKVINSSMRTGTTIELILLLLNC